MEDFSEKNIKANCPHCDPSSFALKHPLKETDNFWVVCDVHPISKGHILIIPKAHLSCIGEYPTEIYNEFVELYEEFSKFLIDKHHAVSTFEHGKVSQTVFHSHVHLLPFDKDPLTIIPEGKEMLSSLNDLSELKSIYQRDGAYLFFSIMDKLWVVDTTIAAPRFFRDRFANALGHLELGNWKEMRANEEFMKEANKNIRQLESDWATYDLSDEIIK